MNIFYTQKIHGSSGILNETESHHCTKVLRMEVGDPLILVDGQGGFYEGNISIADQKACVIEITKSHPDYGKRSYKIHVAIAPTKNIERFEWFLEKATEIGIDEITPLICKHSERKVLREDRLEKVILSAMKQSIKAYLPVLHELTQFEKFVSLNFTGNKLIAHCRDEERHELIQMHPTETLFTVLIGPEGDFSENEIQMAITNGFLPTSLGVSRLRTETAGIAVCQIIQDLIAIHK
jgi:16S rRNA (uracil1498-N3)-methyltransferase